jgi:hypothetical protein
MNLQEKQKAHRLLWVLVWIGVIGFGLAVFNLVGDGSEPDKGDSEATVKKFDHFEFFNVSGALVKNVTMELTGVDEQGEEYTLWNSPYVLGDVENQQKVTWVLNKEDVAGVKKAVCRFTYEAGNPVVPHVRFCELAAYPPYVLRSATFWCGVPPGKTIPTLCGEGLAVHNIDDPFPDTKVVPHTTVDDE